MLDLISIVLISSNNLSHIKVCLESIRSWDLSYELIVVNNGADDSIISYLNQFDEVKLIINQGRSSNLSVVNQSIKAASTNYILLLAADVIIGKKSLKNLLSCIKSKKNIGIVGPRTNGYAAGKQGGVVGDFSNLDKIIEYSNRFNQYRPEKYYEVEEIYDFCILIKREVFEKISYFDAHLENSRWADSDFCKRVRKLGYKLYCAGDTFVYQFLNKKRIRKKFLVVGHPRSGTGYMSKLLHSFNYDVRHEAMGCDGISSWMFAVKDYQQWTDNTLNRKDFRFKYIIMNIRNPLDIVSSTFFTEDASLAYRKRYLEINGLNKLEIAVESIIKWYNLIEILKPDLKIKVDRNCKEKLYYFLKRFEDESLIMPESSISNNENSREHPTLSIDDIRQNCNKNLTEEFINFCNLYGYLL